MAHVIHTVDIVYGSYSEKGYKIACDENDDLDTVKAKVKKALSLNFLAMASYSIKITNTVKRPE